MRVNDQYFFAVESSKEKWLVRLAMTFTDCFIRHHVWMQNIQMFDDFCVYCCGGRPTKMSIRLLRKDSFCSPRQKAVPANYVSGTPYPEHGSSNPISWFSTDTCQAVTLSITPHVSFQKPIILLLIPNSKHGQTGESNAIFWSITTWWIIPLSK